MTKRGNKTAACALAAVLGALVGACGGGGGGGSVSPPAPPPPVVVAPPTQFAVGGTLSGLGQGAVLTLANGSEKLSVSANGKFAFANKLATGAAFDISAVPPEGYTCKVTGGTGVLAAADAGATSVACAPIVLAGVPRVLTQPVAVASDGNGNLYVANAGNHSIMKLSSSGTWSVLAGGAVRPGHVDGPGASARFWFGTATDLVVDAQGNLLVGDACNHVVRKVAPDGTVSTLAGRAYPCSNVPWEDAPKMFVDGTGTAAVFEAPGRMVADGAGGALMVEITSNGVLRSISANGVVTSRRYDGYPSLRSVARAADGTVYLSDDSNLIWKDVAGSLVLVAGRALGSGAVDGTGAAARFAAISDMIVAPGGDIYVADAYSVRKVTPAGQVTTIAGDAAVRGNADGQGSAARFGPIGSIALEAGGLVALDTQQGILRRVAFDGTVTTLAATPAVRTSLDGAGSAARFSSIASLAADADGNLYFADSSTHVLRKATPDGTVTTIAGTAGVSGRVDGPLASATFASPSAVAAGRDGSIWVLQGAGLRRIANGNVTTVDPVVRGLGLAIDADGNAIVATGGNGSQVLRFTPAGQKTILISKETVWALTKDANHWFTPQSVAVDAAGNIYAADTATVAVYKLSKAGELSVFAGTLLKETGDVDGPVGTATLGFYEVDYMTIDEAGNLYLSGQGGVRKISPAGIVSSPAFGWGQAQIGAVAYAKGKLYAMAPYALLQAWLP